MMKVGDRLKHVDGSTGILRGIRDNILHVLSHNALVTWTNGDATVVQRIDDLIARQIKLIAHLRSLADAAPTPENVATLRSAEEQLAEFQEEAKE